MPRGNSAIREPAAHDSSPALTRADDLRSAAITRYGTYLCLDLTAAAGTAVATAVNDLVRRFEFANEFEAPHPPSVRTIGFRRDSVPDAAGPTGMPSNPRPKESTISSTTS